MHRCHEKIGVDLCISVRQCACVRDHAVTLNVSTIQDWNSVRHSAQRHRLVSTAVGLPRAEMVYCTINSFLTAGCGKEELTTFDPARASIAGEHGVLEP